MNYEIIEPKESQPMEYRIIRDFDIGVVTLLHIIRDYRGEILVEIPLYECPMGVERR